MSRGKKGTNVFSQKRTVVGTGTIRRVQARQAMQEFMHTSQQQLSHKVKEDVQSFDTLDIAWKQTEYLGTQIVLLREAVLRADMKSPDVAKIRQSVAKSITDIMGATLQEDPATYLAISYFNLRNCWGLDGEPDSELEAINNDLDLAVKLNESEMDVELAKILQVLINTAPKDLDQGFSQAEKETALVSACNWLRTCSAKLADAAQICSPAIKVTTARENANTSLINGLRSEIDNPFNSSAI